MNNCEFISSKKNTIFRICGAFFALGLCGCTTTILDKHNEMIKSNPGKIHYATAVPFGAYNLGFHSNKQAAYNEACIYYGGRPSYERKAEYPYKWFSGMGGRSQDEVESYAINQCETQTDRTCVVVLYNNFVRCDATFPSAYAREQDRAQQRKDSANRASVETQKKKSEQMSETCISFGFRANTPELSSCILEMHKSLAQIEAINNASNRQASALEAANAAAIKLREFEQGMMLLQRSSDLLNSNQSGRPTLKCRHDTIMNTITCN